MGKIYKTYEQFDQIDEAVEKIKCTSAVWYPTEEYYKEITNHMEVYLPYLVWLTEYTVPQDECDSKLQKQLRRLLNANLELVDEPEEIPPICKEEDDFEEEPLR